MSLYTPLQIRKDGSFVRAIFFLSQAAAVATASVIVAFFWPSAALSVLLGGVLAIIATLGFVAVVFARRRMHGKHVMQAMIFGEILKIAVIAGLFIIVLQFVNIQLIAFLIGFGSAYAVYFISPLLV